MLRSILCGLALSLSLSTAYAAHGTMVPIPGYDYKKEKKTGYVKDYCEDSVGNHVVCAPEAKDNFKAEVKPVR